jgi:hypothetical protein
MKMYANVNICLTADDLALEKNVQEKTKLSRSNIYRIGLKMAKEDLMSLDKMCSDKKNIIE